MILLISDSQPCIARSVVPKKCHKVAYLQTGSSSFTDTLDAILERDDLSLAIIECQGKEKDSLLLISAIKKRRTDVPVMFIASTDTDRSIAEAFRRGARDCFRNPFDVALFRERVQRILSFRNGQREQRVPMLTRDEAEERGDGGECLLTSGLPEGVLRVMSFIEDNISDRDLTVVRLARVAGMSPFHFCRDFKKRTMLSPIQFVTRMRLERAKKMLKYRSGNMSISQIATASGFYDASNLNKHFKRATGLTPTQFSRCAASR